MGQLDDNAIASISAVAGASGDPVIRISGELDISNIADIEAELGAILGTATPPVTIDLSSLTFIDSSGIAMLLRAADQVGPMTIREPTPIARQIITATGLADVLRIGE